jgi:hypothetical protein
MFGDWSGRAPYQEGVRKTLLVSENSIFSYILEP